MKPMIETAETLYYTEKKRVLGIILFGVLILLCSIFYGLNAGSIHFSVQEVMAAFFWRSKCSSTDQYDYYGYTFAKDTACCSNRGKSCCCRHSNAGIDGETH